MNKQAYWMGFIKAAYHSGLSNQQITYFLKRAAGQPMPQPSPQPPTISGPAGMGGAAPGGMAGMSGGQFGGLPQSPAGQGQMQPGMSLPFMLQQQHMQQLT